MRQYKSAGLVFRRMISVITVSALILSACAGIAVSQSLGGYTSMPGGQYQYDTYGQNTYSPQTDAQQYLPADYPPTIQVDGLDMTGLVAGDNNVSYAIKVTSQNDNDIYFQIQAFCVYNTQSQYAILHVLNTPLSGVIDKEKNTLQIDFSKLPQSIDSIKVINVGDVDKVLMQSSDVMVLNTVMSIDSSDGSTVKFSISDMSLLEPDGVLNDLALPGPVQGVYDIGDARFSTVAYPELANLFQQNYVAVQQNTFISVVNQVNVINVVNVAGFGGCGYGLPYGGYYGGYDGYYGGYGGCPAPYVDPLPLPVVDTWAGAPLRVPEHVRTYGDVLPRVHGHMDTGDVRGDRVVQNGEPAIIDDTGSRARTRDMTGIAPASRREGLSATQPDTTRISSGRDTGRQALDQASGSKQSGDTRTTTRQDPATSIASTPKAPKAAATKPDTTADRISQSPASASGQNTNTNVRPSAKTVSRPTAPPAPKQTSTRTDATKPTVQQSSKSTPQTKTVSTPSDTRTSVTQPVKSSSGNSNKQSAPTTVKSTGNKAPQSNTVKSAQPATQQSSKSAPQTKTVSSPGNTKSAVTTPVKSSGGSSNKQSAPVTTKSTPRTTSTVNKAPQSNAVKSAQPAAQHAVTKPSSPQKASGSSNTQKRASSSAPKAPSAPSGGSKHR